MPHVTVIRNWSVALALVACASSMMYGQQSSKMTEQLQYVPPPSRVVMDSVVGTADITSGTPARYATVVLSPATDYEFCGMGCVSKVLASSIT